MIDERVLVIEADAERARTWQTLLEFADYASLAVPDPDQVPWQQRPWLAALIGQQAGGRELRSVLTAVRNHDPSLPILALGSDSAVTRAQSLCWSLQPPLKYPHLVDALRQARRHRPQEVGAGGFPVGRSAAISELSRLLEQVAVFDSTVLVLGESGVGKELVARRIHQLSPRRAAPFVPLNCGAIPAELLESELFGHEKGAFTGAISTRAGRFELAEGGTLFLDEIGDMSLPMQVKLLRVLQERTYERVGSPVERRADVRVIAATHRDLEQRVAEDRFREDLFFRLNVFPLRVPALRERVADIPALIDDLTEAGQREGRPTIQLSRQAGAALAGYPWPGNVRELANLLERLSILYPNRTVQLEDLPARYRRSGVLCREPEAGNGAVSFPGAGLDLKAHLSRIERQLIEGALEEANGTVAQAARLLKLRRTTLVEKLRKYQI